MATKKEVIQKLFDQSIVFANLNPLDLAKLEPLFEVEKYAAGEIIAEQGETMKGLYYLHSGTVRFKILNPDGKRTSLGARKAGSSFAEISLIKPTKWEYQVSAESDVILLLLPADKVAELFKADPAFKSSLSQKIGLLEVQSRLAKLLGSGGDPKLMAEIYSQIGVKKIPAGKAVFQQGQDDPRIYYIESGSVELVRDAIEGRLVLEKVSSGGLIGEYGAITGEPQPHSAIALSDVTVLVIRQNEVRKILEFNYDLKMKLEQRIRDLYDLEEAATKAKSPKVMAEGVDQRIQIDAITEADFKAMKKKTEIAKFPFIRQHEEAECAAACLTMIVKYYGKDFSLGQIQELCNISTSEAPIPVVCTAAERLGFRVKPYKCTYEDLQHLELPCLLFWESYHYVVLYRITDKTVQIADPAKGLVTLKRVDFERSWTGIAIHLITTQAFETLEPPKNPYWFFMGYLLPFKAYFGEALLAAIIINLLTLTSPLFIQVIVDKVVVHQDQSLLNIMLVGMVLVTIFRLMTTAAQSLLLAHTVARIDMKLVSEFFRHILSLPMPFFITRRTGDILSRFGENQKIRRLLSGSTVTVILNTLMLIIYMVMMYIYNASLTWIVLIFIPMYIANTVYFTPKLKNIANEIFVANSNSQSLLIEALKGIEAVKATANEYYARSRWEDSFVDTVNLGYRSAKLSLISSSIAQLIQLGSTVVILYYGAILVMAGQLSIGELMGFNMLMGSVTGPILQMVQLWDSLQEIRISVERVSDINNVKPEQPPVTTSDKMPVVLPEIKGRIEFRNVKFRYGGEETPYVLNGFNLVIEPGQTVALVGPSGCGKSTVIRMVMGFNEATFGEVLIDGIDIKQLDLSSYRRQIGVVLQDSFLFSETVAQNIALGDPVPDMEAVRRAARLASADEFIVRLPLGYQTKVGEKGVQVSGGQRQRICIARALYRQPRILIFDEATSALDNESEQRIQENMRSILANRTAIMIAHRLSTIKEADSICFIENGQLQERGTHDELIAMRGRYYDLAKKQFNLE